MLKILFFARIREQLGVGQLQVNYDESCSTLSKLTEKLAATHGPLWKEVLGQSNVVTAVNQSKVDAAHLLCDDDEVAFYPPVTGG